MLIVSRRAAYECNPPGGEGNRRLSIFSAAQALAPVRTPVSEKCPNQPSSRSPISFYGYLPPLSRRSYQPENRSSSVSRPLLNVSGAASPLGPHGLRGRGFHQTTNDRPGQARTTSGLCGCWRKGRGVRSEK